MRQFVIFLSFLMMLLHDSANQIQGAKSRTDMAEAAYTSKAIYLGNEAILVEHKSRKILFDPFFQNSFNTYQLFPQSIRQSLFKGGPPYHNIDAIFISHAHADHFAAIDVVRFLTTFPGTKVIAPGQAIDQINALSKTGQLSKNLIAIDLAYQDPPLPLSLPEITIDAVGITHAGWPRRAL
ncbi:MAG: ribonuclease BN (tRNA processing enzyme) [Arenicella sp.]|jgi:ribonuclease BN (tRNA processing enzyme)